MPKKLRIILKNKSGVSFPLVIGVTPSLLLISCGVSGHLRLQIIVAGVWDTAEGAIISTVNGNHAGVYHGVQEGYSGGYTSCGEGEWEETLDEGDIHARVDEVLGTRESGGRHVKFAEDSGNVVEFALTDLNVTLRNAPLAPFDPGNAQRFEAKAVIRLEVPIRFDRKLLPSIYITLRVRASYIEVF